MLMTWPSDTPNPPAPETTSEFRVSVAELFHIILGLGLLNTHLGVILPYIAFGESPSSLHHVQVLPRDLEGAR